MINIKPWGAEIVYANHELYSGSILVVKDGERTPYIYHKLRDKTIFVLEGTLSIVVEGKTSMLNERDEVHIPARIMHRFHAIRGDVTILEAGTKIEDDVVVVESDYEKAGKA